MRLVVRDVEMPDAEREVDGVEILERPRQEREMRGEEDQHQRDAGRALAAAH
jgi:CheY-like chemotaxis protein